MSDDSVSMKQHVATMETALFIDEDVVLLLVEQLSTFKVLELLRCLPSLPGFT